MVIYNNIARPTPPASLQELLFILCANIQNNFPNVSRFDEYGHLGPHLYSLGSVDEQNLMYYNYYKAKEWIAGKNFLTGKDRGDRQEKRRLLNECKKRGYDVVKKVIDDLDVVRDYTKVIEISLPEGQLLIGGDNQEVVAAFPGYVIFATDEKPGEFLDAMNELLKYLEDSKKDFSKFIAEAENLNEQIKKTRTGLQEYAESLGGRVSVRDGKLSVDFSSPNTTITLFSDMSSEWLRDFPKIMQAYYDILKSEEYSSLKCHFAGDGISAWKKIVNISSNMVAIAISPRNAIVAKLSDENWDSDFNKVKKMAQKLRDINREITDKFGEKSGESLTIE